MAEVTLSEDSKSGLAAVLDKFSASVEVGYSSQSRVERDQMPVPWLAHLVLVQVIGCYDAGPADKTLWRVPFRYDGVEAVLTLEKFGVRLYLTVPEGVDGEALGNEIIGKINALVKTVEKESLKDLADQKLVDAKVTMLNQHARLRRAYEHFRQVAEEQLKDADAPDTKELGEPGEDGWLTKGISKRFQRLDVGAFNAIAAINAYFSWLEHVLALALAFTGEDPSNGTLKEHLKDRWAEKFARIFNAQDGDATRVRGQLHEIAETYRNTFGHGGYDKRGATVGVQIEGIGVVPARLTDVRRSPHFDMFPFEPASFGEVTASLDEIDKFLREGPARFALQFIESGFDVPFDEDSRREYQRAMTDDETFGKFLDKRGEEIDRIENMEL